MAIQYTWSIQQLFAYPQQDGETDVVFQVAWVYSGVDGEYTGSLSGNTGLSLNPAEPFTPYADLTQEQVIGWVTATIVPEQLESMQLSIANQIEQEKNPPVVSPPLPWAATPLGPTPINPEA